MAERRPIRRALISVYDKTGVVHFARALHDEFGVEIISTGGTAGLLREAGIPVTLVEALTGFPGMLDGRVKTLHPAIHAAILADRDNPEHMRQLEAAGIRPIDMVVVNLYPFEKAVADPNCTFEQAIEMIDIGGVALLRAAAKNHRHVLVVTSQRGMSIALSAMREGDLDRPLLRIGSPADVFFGIGTGAFEAYFSTSAYDDAIAQWLSTHFEEGFKPAFRTIRGCKVGELRYGENSHQQGEALQLDRDGADLTVSDSAWCDLQPAMSYNNYLDADAALGLCAELTRAGGALWERCSSGHHEPTGAAGSAGPTRSTPACVFVKHSNPCGVGVAVNPVEAYRQAYLGDPNAAMGGVLAVNFEVTAEFAQVVMETYDRFGKPLKDARAPHAPGGFFVEVWLAPSFSDDAVRIIRGTAEPTPDRPNPPKKKWGENVRLLAMGDLSQPPDPDELLYRSIAGGLLVQTPDLLGLNEEQWKVVTKRAPTESEISDLRLAWLIAKHTRSNAISIVHNGMLIGNGAGQTSRVMSCRVAAWLARENGHLAGTGSAGVPPAGAGSSAGSAGVPPANGPVAASDAFFPFRDGPDILIDAGVTALIQPGGSKRDEETIRACDERGVAMIFTGTRHFRH